LQWLDTEQGGLGLREIYKIEDALEAVSHGEYFVDGHDSGSGTVNVFLYAEDSGPTRRSQSSSVSSNEANLAHPYHHAVRSVRLFGGVPQDYLKVHDWFDESKAHIADFRRPTR
jgi:hypothetical protein